MESDDILARKDREEKLQLAAGRNTSRELLSRLAGDEDEEIRLVIALNNSTPKTALYSQLDFESIRFKVTQLRDWIQIYGEIEEIDESKLSEYSQFQVWSENNSQEYEVILESGAKENANRLFVSKNSRAGEDEVSVVTAIFDECPYPIEFDEFDFDGVPNCCGGENSIYIDLENLVKDDSNESIVKNIEWANPN
jgi:hypothetical protein